MTQNEHPEQDPAEGADDLPPPDPGGPKTDKAATEAPDDKVSDDAQLHPEKDSAPYDRS